MQVFFSFAGERPAKEKLSAAAGAGIDQHWAAAGEIFLSGRLSRPVKKITFLCDLCASAVKIPFRSAHPR